MCVYIYTYTFVSRQKPACEALECAHCFGLEAHCHGSGVRKHGGGTKGS